MIAFLFEVFSDNLKEKIFFFFFYIFFYRQSKIENGCGFPLIALGIVICGAVAEAQQTKARPRIAVLSSRVGPLPTREGAFQEGLRKLRNIEGQNITIEYRYAEEKLDRLPDMANELVRSKVDLIVAVSTPAIKAAKNSTNTIPPIIMAGVSDPIGTGFVESLARPGGNITWFLPAVPGVERKTARVPQKQVNPELLLALALLIP